MKIDTLAANERKATGSNRSRAIRLQGRIPAVLYGHNEDPQHLDVSEEDMLNVLRAGRHMVDLQHNDNSERAVIKEIQYDTLSEKIMHIDFTRVKAGEKVKVELPVNLLGTPEGLKHGGILQPELEIITVECLPENLPDNIEVRITDMNVNDILHVSDLPVLPGLTYLTDAKHAVVHILPPRKEEEVEEAAEEAPAGTEPEVLTERKEEGDEETKKGGGKAGK